jgi:FixJ family two-component response regulator
LSEDFFLQKPFSRATLIEKVQEALRRTPVGVGR